MAAATGWADAVRWTGGSGGWSVAANWRNGADEPCVPSAGDDVVIASDAPLTVTLDGAGPTPALHSLTVGGGAGETALCATNWNAVVVAAQVTVAAQGVLTCTGAYEPEAMGRVWIRCADLTVAAGGRIDVSERGYLAAEKPAKGVINGYGPGGAVSYGMGASHGGLGGLAVFSIYSNPVMHRKPDFSDMLYDDPSAPVEPGSSGRTSQWLKGGSGGGAVRIEATGRVTVDGAILASGGGVATSNIYQGNSHGTGGSGGSVYIDCETIAGAGIIRADGGDGHFTIGRQGMGNSVIGLDRPETYGDMVGGGGMIAIHYAAAKQTAGLVSGMTVSAAPGLYTTFYCCKGPTRATEDRYFCHGDLGTLHFTDATLVADLLGKGLSGQVLGFSEWTCGDLDFTNGFVRFTGEGFKLKVNGDLNVRGENVRLDVAGVAVTNRVFRPEVWAGGKTVRVEVDGSICVADGARLDIRAAATNGADQVGAAVTVGRTLAVCKGGWLYAWCDSVSGGAPAFSVGNLAVEAGGHLTAEGRGFAGGVGRANGASDTYWNRHPVGYGPTGGFSVSAYTVTYPDGTQTARPSTGGSHGGLGGLSTLAEGADRARATTCDDAWWPALPGSGGGANTMAFGNGAGGGVIHVNATNHIQIDGEVSADAGRTWAQSGAASGGAGGTILLSGKTFAGGATGVLTARGGDIGQEGENHAQAAGAGGGGRIAVWIGEGVEELKSARVEELKSSEVFEFNGLMVRTFEGTRASGFKGSRGCAFLGAASATGGTNLVSQLPVATGATLNGGDGTVRFAHVTVPSGTSLFVTGASIMDDGEVTMAELERTGYRDFPVRELEEMRDLEAFDNAAFEETAKYGVSKDGHVEIGRFGVNGGGGARVWAKPNQTYSYVLKHRDTVYLKKGTRYVLSSNIRMHGKISCQTCADVNFRNPRTYAFGAWGPGSEDIGDGWVRHSVDFVPQYDYEDLEYHFKVYCRVANEADFSSPDNYVDVDNIALHTAAPKWYFCNTWPTHNKVFAERGRVRAHSEFLGSYLESRAIPVYLFRLTTPEGALLAQRPAVADAKGNMTVELGELAYAGDAVLAVTLYDIGNKLNLGTREIAVTVAPTPDVTQGVFVQENGIVLRDGQPYMPIGFYTDFAYATKHTTAESEALMAQLQTAGFNAMIDYGCYTLNSDARRDWYFGACDRYGLGVVANGAQTVFAKYHAHLGWYTMDEAPESEIPRLSELRRMLNAAAPDKIVNICNIMRPAPFLPCADIQGGDEYPIKAGAQLLDCDKEIRAMADTAPAAIWHAPQAYNWASSVSGTLTNAALYAQSGREPQENEMLSVALLMASYGVRGFFFYSHFDVWRCPVEGWSEQRWQGVCGACACLRSLEPFIMSGEPIVELAHTDMRGTARVVAFSDGKGAWRVAIMGLEKDHETTFVLPEAFGRLKSRCGKTVCEGGIYAFRGKDFSCDVLE